MCWTWSEVPTTRFCFDFFSDSLLAGVTQEVKVRLHTGSSAIETGSKVTVVPPTGLHANNKMAATGSCLGDTVVLEQAGRGATVEWKMDLLQETTSTGGDTLEKKVASMLSLNELNFDSSESVFLAHLSQRLTGELIVYPCSGIRLSVVHNFKDLLL